MTEHPTLFSAPMVRRILSGDKVQTRRVIKPQPEHLQHHVHKKELVYEGEHRMWCWKDLVLENLWDFPDNEDRKTLAERCPHGQVGNRLWVRETWCSSYQNGGWGTAFHADMTFDLGKRQHEKGPHFHGKELGPHVRWRPSIFLPRWASRITLEITDIRVQKLQEISEEDAIAEDVEPNWCGELSGWKPAEHGWIDYLAPHEDSVPCYTAKESFQSLWQKINVKKYPWSQNPFIWAITFRKI